MTVTAGTVRASTTLSPLVAQAAAFTDAYKRFIDAPTAIREAMCLKTQYPAATGDLRQNDVLAGRHPSGRIAYVGTMWWAAPPKAPGKTYSPTKQGGYCFDFDLAERAGKTDEEKQILAELSAFWTRHCTYTKVHALYDEEMRRFANDHSPVGIGANGFCVTVHSDRLLQRGLPGLMADVIDRQRRAEQAGEDTSLFEGMRVALEVVADVARHYRDQAMRLSDASDQPADRGRLLEVAATLDAITKHAPQTFRQAVQLFWLYTHLVSGNHPEAFRLDQSLGDFYVRDVDSGRLTENDAVELLVSLWRMFSENGADALCRIVIGGLGRRNPANADRFALAAMEATRRHKRVTPQLTLRFHSGMDPRLMSKAYDCIGEGCCYPMLYNDDVCVPGVQRSMNVPREAAENYYPLGCGEYMIGWSSPSLLCCGWNVPKSLDAALHNGVVDGERVGPETGDLSSLDTYQKLYDAMFEQIRFGLRLSAKAYRRVREGVAPECPFLLASLLTDDCLERGKGILEGSRYIGGCLMGHGFTNTADALVAIDRVVYQQKRLTLAELVAALDANFESHDDIRRMLAASPKFGNDIDEVDSVFTRLWSDINAEADAAGQGQQLGFHTVSSVNPGGYGAGECCGATADGRLKGQPFAIGLAPTAGRDTSGLTPLFNSVAKADAASGGAATNFKISRELFTQTRPKLEAMFAAYFDRGGQEATVTVVNRDDLQAAIREPQNYGHVLVRLGGWCARFVELDRTVQEEIIRRTLY